MHFFLCFFISNWENNSPHCHKCQSATHWLNPYGRHLQSELVLSRIYPIQISFSYTGCNSRKRIWKFPGKVSWKIRLVKRKYHIHFSSIFDKISCLRQTRFFTVNTDSTQLLYFVNRVLTTYVLFVTNFAAIGLDKFAEYVVATSNYTISVTIPNNKNRILCIPTPEFPQTNHSIG